MKLKTIKDDNELECMKLILMEFHNITRRFKMTKYWKADTLRKLIKLEEETDSDQKATITMSYLTYLKRMLKMLEEKE